MKLIRLSLENFKGIKSFTLEPNGKNIAVYGDNATGKTTIFDGFLWLLFDKDSQNQANFDIKTLGPDGDAIHGLDHTVEAVLQLKGGMKITLKKTYREKWTKQRGSATKTFTGHTVDHFIDGVPATKTEYTKKVASLIDEGVFKLLTSPMYFNTVLHWQERRKILLEVCGDITDQEVIDSNETLKDLPKILGGRSLEGHRKVIMSRRAEINRELDRIPTRISEVQHGLPDISLIKPDALADDIAKLRALVQEREQEKARGQAGGGAAEKIKELREIEGELIRVQNEHRQQQSGESIELQNKLYAVHNARLNLEGDINRLERQRTDADAEIKTLDQKLNDLRQEWHRINKTKFEHTESDTCPTCGQMLPKAQVEAAREKAEAEFNQAKARDLEAVNAEGKRLKARRDELDKRLADLTQQLEASRQTLEDVRKEEDKLQAQVEAAKSEVKPITDNPEYQKLLEQKQQVEAEIEALKASNQEAVGALQKEIDGYNQDIAALERAQAEVEQYERGQERIKELQAEEKRLAKEYEALEKQLYLTEEFVRTKVRLLEERINSKFELARFKLFQEQVNGGLAECCEVQYNGVPYSSLNNAARINIGLDIIRTLSRHYEAEAPIFIDNAEAVVELLPMDAQVIKLVVSGADKKLRIETPGKEPTLFDGIEKEAS
jgi:DNA repair exonuclease SbcCD ATPase subunit